MQARDVMTTHVVTVRPDTLVAEIARTLLERHVSGVPVVDAGGRLVGIVSEGDLMRRPESSTEAPRSWWLAILALPDEDQRRYVKVHGQHAEDVMTRDVVTVPPDTTLAEIATRLEDGHLKRVPVVEGGKLVGIVSRADLLRGLASSQPTPVPAADDRTLRDAVEAAIRQHAGSDGIFVGAVVTNGAVRLWGGVRNEAAKDAARVAAENVPGVKSVDDRISILPRDASRVLWAE